MTVHPCLAIFGYTISPETYPIQSVLTKSVDNISSEETRRSENRYSVS